MLKNKVIVIGLFSMLIFSPFIPNSEAELWELIIELNIQKGAIYSGESVIITGKVVDHAYTPIRGAEVFIRAGADTAKTLTDSGGMFRVEFKDFQRTPGSYTVNVVASWHGMTGLTSTQFQVKGEISQVSVLQEKLNTERARKYLGADESDFEKNPIGQTLFKYYHGLLDKLILEQKKARLSVDEQDYLEQQRKIADNLRDQAIKEFNPSPGIYGGFQYENYIDSLNPEIRDLVVSQLNFTKNNFEQAQIIRDKILANGGTYEDAMQAYLDKITIPREALEQFNQENIEKANNIVKGNQTDNKNSDEQ